MPRIRLIKSAHISALDPLHSPTIKLSAVHTAIIEIAVSELKAPLAIGKYGLLTLSSFLSYTWLMPTIETFINTAATTACAACLAATRIELISRTCPNCHAIMVTEDTLTCVG